MLEVYEHHAYDYHDTLIEMGGRPTRAVLQKPAWKAIYEKHQIRIVDVHGELECTLAPNENLTLHHWSEECSRFDEELERWNEFRDYQRNKELPPLLKTAFDSESTDQRLMKILIRLNDWREFQHYQQVKVGRATMLTWKITRAIEKIVRKEAISDNATPSHEISYELDTCLDKLFRRQRDLETSEKQLTWIESQIPAILSEACASLESAHPLQRQLDIKLEQQVNAFYQELKILEARPDHPVQIACEPVGFAQKICHWGSEVSRLMHQLWEWKIFLKWRRMQPSESKPAHLEEQESSERSSNLQIWVDYVTYRRFQLDRTRSWAASWQRLLKKDENEMKTAPKDLGLIFLQDSITMAREYVERFQQDIYTAESQVQLAEQQLAELSSEYSSSTIVQVTEQSTSHPRLPPSPPESDSVEIIPGDFQLTNLSSSPEKVRRSRGSTESPIGAISESVQQSNLFNEIWRLLAKKDNINKTQPVTVADVVIPDRVIVNEEFQMTAAPDDLYRHEMIEDSGAELIDTHRSGVEDTLMIDSEDPVNTSSRPTLKVDSKGRSTARKLPLPTYLVPTSRKTRSAAKLDSGRILKKIGKKQVRKVMTLTEQQSLTLQNAASTSYPLAAPISLRRSERLEKKIAASAVGSSPQSNTVETPK